MATAQWVRLNAFADSYVFCLYRSHGYLFAGAGADGTVAGALWRSSDHGVNWEPGLAPGDCQPRDFAAIGDSLFAGTLCEGVQCSTDLGNTWVACNWGLGDHSYLISLYVEAMTEDGGRLFVGTNVGLFVTTDRARSWMRLDSPYRHDPTSLFVHGDTIYAGGYGGVDRLVFDGSAWTVKSLGLDAGEIHFARIGDRLFASSFQGVHELVGETWVRASAGITDSIEQSLYAHDGVLFVGSYGGNVYVSVDTGHHWVSVGEGLEARKVYSLLSDSIYLYAAIEGSGVWRRPLTEIITPVRDVDNAPPRGVSLDQNYPNPFSSTTTVSFRLPPESGAVPGATMKYYDLLGREVLEMHDRPTADVNTVEISSGQLPAGSYIYVLRYGSTVLRRMCQVIR